MSMARVNRTQADLVEASEHLQYEIMMLFSTANHFGHTASVADINSKTP